ncbi:MAG: FtsB family cell division protein [Bdellovibrionota bacterium]|jgi:cell division protein FtsB
MKYYGSAIFFALTCCILVLSFCGKDSYSQVEEFRHSLEWQRKENAKLLDKVNLLKRKVSGLQEDRRVLEKAARNELGMARPDEFIVIFEKKEDRGE